jgi:hypothetical protein
MTDTFDISGDGNFIKITFDEVFGFPESTCHWGGYDVHSNLEIKSGDIHVKSSLYMATGDVYRFTQELKKCNDILSGSAAFDTCEGNFQFSAKYDNTGHVAIEGEFETYGPFKNQVKFGFETDQSFISQTLEQLDMIVSKYGDEKGIKK